MIRVKKMFFVLCVLMCLLLVACDQIKGDFFGIVSATGFEIDGNDVYMEVPSSTESYSFIDQITVSTSASWELYSDINAINKIASKTIDLSTGDNTVYILVTRKDEIKLYTVIVKRLSIYQIDFNSNGGSDVSSINISGNSTVVLPTNPTKEGYEFAGWYFDNNTFTRLFTATSILDEPILSDITVYAKWILDGDPIDNTPTNVVILYQGEEPIIIGQTKQLTGSVVPTSATQTVIWSVDDEDVATISATGLLTAVSEGTVNVTATSTELTTISETIQFMVIESDEQKMEKINAVEAIIRNLLSIRITEDYTLPDYTTNPDITVKYIYDGISYDTGSVFEYRPKQVDYTQSISVNITYSGKEKTFDFVFTIAGILNLYGITGSSYVLVGETTTLIRPLDATNITWSSSNTSAATVDNNGVVTGVAVGETLITFMSDQARCTFAVSVIAPENVVLLLAYQAKNYIISNIPIYTSTNFNLPTTYIGVTIEYEIDSLPVTSFTAVQDIYNTVATVDVTITVNTTVVTFEVYVVVMAKTDDIIANEALSVLDAYLEEKGYNDADFRATSNLEFAGFTCKGVSITWTSNNLHVISNSGFYYRGNDDVNVSITVRLTRNSEIRSRKFTILVGGYSKDEKIEYITTNSSGVLKNLMNGSTKSGVELPSTDTRFGTTITWTSSNTDVLNNDGSLVAQVTSPVQLTLYATITYYKGEDNINNFVEIVEVPFTVNPFDNNAELAAYYYKLEADCVPLHFPYGKDGITKLTGLDMTYEKEGTIYNLSWAPADTTIFDANFNLLKQYFMHKNTVIVATLTVEGTTDTATAEFTINVGIAENLTDIAVALTSDVPLAGFDYDKWCVRNGLLGAADGGSNIVDNNGFARSWQGFSGNIFKTTITVKNSALEDVNYVIYVIVANTNCIDLFARNTKDGNEYNYEDPTKKYLASTGLSSSSSYGKVVKNTTASSIWVKDKIGYFSGFNYLSVYQATILNFDSETKLCNPIVIPMDSSGTEYEIKPGGFLIQRGYIDQGVYDLLKKSEITVEHLVFTRK